MSLLETISNPHDLKTLPMEKLSVVARDVREALLGHFDLDEMRAGSAAGVTDLTIALNYVFDFSHDSLVFDMAHQAAAHMMLARHDKSCDQATCVPWFGHESEPWDTFLDTHAGTSISKALGLAAGRQDGAKTVAVIGDGAIVSGIALEALNRGGELDEDVLVVLNDNEMSISKVVGAMGEYLSKIRVGKAYNELKRDAHKLLQKVPIIGSRLDRAAEQMKEAVAKALVPGHLFESLGPRYFGPVDGHNIAHLIPLLRDIQKQKGFFLLHVVTQRGAGADAGEAMLRRDAAAAVPGMAANADRVVSYAVEYERQGERPWIDALADAAVRAADERPEVAVVVASVPESVGLGRFRRTFAERHENRLWDVGVNEQHGVAFAAGLAKAERRPIVVAPASVLARAHDQVRREVVGNKLPVTFVVAMAGIVEDRCVDHGLGDIAWMRSLPGLQILAPRDAGELDRMLDYALDHTNPIAIRIPDSFAAHSHLEYPLRAELVEGGLELLRRGSDVAILALGPLVYPVMEAADVIAEKGLEATIANARFVHPLDPEAVRTLLNDHTLLFVVEEHGAGGLRSAVLELAATERMDASRIIPIGLPDAFLRQGPRARILQQHGLDGGGLADRMVLDYRRHVRSR